jgi:hypothetical protein
LKDMFVVFDEILQARIKGEKWPNHTKQSPKAKKKTSEKKVLQGKNRCSNSHTLTTFQEKKGKREPPPGSISASAVKCLRMNGVF